MSDELSSRRAVLVGVGAAAIAASVGIQTKRPRRTHVYESTSAPPTADPSSPIVLGEPNATVSTPSATAMLATSTVEAEQLVKWDMLLPDETSEPYRQLGNREVLSVVATRIPSNAELLDIEHSIDKTRITHRVGVKERSSMDDSFPLVRRYMLNKWFLGWQRVPSSTTVELSVR